MSNNFVSNLADTILIIREAQVRELLSPNEAAQAVSAASKALARGEAQNVPRVRARGPGISLHTMSAIHPSGGVTCCKVYTATREKVQMTILLYDTETGNLLAMIEGNELGRLRTAAASLEAAKVLAPRESKTLGIIGFGSQGQAALEAFVSSAFFSFERVVVYRRKQESLARDLAQCALPQGISLEGAKNAKEVLENTDILVTATSASRPVFDSNDLSDIKHVSALGSNSLARYEIPPRSVGGAAYIVVDSIDVARLEAGDLLRPIENGKVWWSHLWELGDVLLASEEEGGAPFVPEEGYTLFSSQGLAVWDLFAAKMVYDKLIGSAQQVL